MELGAKSIKNLGIHGFLRMLTAVFFCFLMIFFWSRQHGPLFSNQERNKRIEIPQGFDPPSHSRIFSSLVLPASFPGSSRSEPSRQSDTLVSSQSSASRVRKVDPETLEPYQNGDQWGFKDPSGQIAIPASFEEAWEFRDGVALVKVDGKFGFVDATGGFIAPPVFEEAFAYTDGLADVKFNGKYGFVDQLGNVVISPRFDYAWPFSHGLALIREGDKFGYIDRKGGFIARPEYDVAWAFTEGLAGVSLNGKFGYIDIHGNQVISPQFDYAWHFENGLALVQSGNHLWYIDKQGHFVKDYRP